MWVYLIELIEMNTLIFELVIYFKKFSLFINIFTIYILMWVYLIELIEMNTVIFVIDFESYDFGCSFQN